MKRDYDTGTAEDIQFFTGYEVEKTPAHSMLTLFVTGLQSVKDIETRLGDIQHIFFGANHSFNPVNNIDWDQWEDIIQHFLSQDILCTLDIPLSCAEQFLEGPLVEYDNFIPQIRVPIPHIKLWNYNTMLKIDDKDFRASNPGVWCHSLHDLMDRDKFTDWTQYTLDKPLD